MPNCPKCNEKIDNLHLYERFEKKYRYSIDDTIFIDDIAIGDIEFECPECNEALFDDYDDAYTFLKGVTNGEEER